MHYVPHTDEEIQEMLAFIGLDSLDELFSMVPQALRLAGGLNFAKGLSEFDTMAEVERLANANKSELICFAGAGAYDHEIPSAVRRVASRTEFVTSYTPYQAEVAQGVLQSLFEYQTLISRLSGLPVSNASLYDGATALVEALNLTVAASGLQGVLMSDGVHPNWREVAKTMAVGTGHDLRSVALKDGLTDWSTAQTEGVGTVVVQYPNYYGCLENVTEARALADKIGAKLVVAYDPIATGLLKTPGELGADVAIAEGQPFGTPMSLGGPYVGLFSCRMEEVRRLPGRVAGQTIDAEGKKAYVTTLRTREQDIRREKATSNICTNQTLIAVTAAIQLSWLGTKGLRETAIRCARGTKYLREELTKIEGVETCFSAPTLREFAICTPISGELVIERMADVGFLAGVPIEDKSNAVLLSVTEKRTKQEIDSFVTAFGKAVGS